MGAPRNMCRNSLPTRTYVCSLIHAHTCHIVSSLIVTISSLLYPAPSRATSFRRPRFGTVTRSQDLSPRPLYVD